MSDLDNYNEEKRSAYLYQVLAQYDPHPAHKKLFMGLALLAEKQAAIWAETLTAKQLSVPGAYRPDLRVRLVLLLVKCFGIRSLRVVLAAMKVRGMSIYGGSLPHADSSHSPELETRHGQMSWGNNLRAAVFGVNDGLISNASLILGVAGAQVSHDMIFLTGVAGLLAGAFSMGAGEYVSVRSQREMLEYQLKLEKKELELYPEEEAEELSLIYQARGIPQAEADKVASLLIQNPEKALDTLAREELGINPQDLVSPLGAAIASFVSFSIGAFVPLVPYLFNVYFPKLAVTILLTGLSLFTVGAVMSLFTQRSFMLSGLRMLFIGSMAGAVTYLIGNGLGVDRL